MLIVTIDSIPGYEIKVVLGTVVASQTLSMADAAATTAGMFRPRPVGAPPRQDVAFHEAVRQAAERGANAIVGLRIDMANVYGTAVRVVPITPEAMAQYQSMVQAGQAPAL